MSRKFTLWCWDDRIQRQLSFLCHTGDLRRVALVARRYEVNANQVFAWRRVYRKGRLETVASAALLPVTISDAIPAPAQSQRKSKPIRRGVIDIDSGHVRVRHQPYSMAAMQAIPPRVLRRGIR
jgi:transposase